LIYCFQIYTLTNFSTLIHRKQKTQIIFSFFL